MGRDRERARASQKKFYTLCCFLPSDIFEFSWNLLLTASPFDEVCEVSPPQVALDVAAVAVVAWHCCQLMVKRRQQLRVAAAAAALEPVFCST